MGRHKEYGYDIEQLRIRRTCMRSERGYELTLKGVICPDQQNFLRRYRNICFIIYRRGSIRNLEQYK